MGLHDNGLSVPKSTRPSTPLLLRVLARLFSTFPAQFFRRHYQMAIDAVLSAVSVYLAFNLRFDFSVRPEFVPVMWLWILLVPIIRPVSMYFMGAYQGIWRYFNLQDATVLTLSAAPVSLLMLGARFFLARRTWTASIPFTVTVIELGTYLALAAGARALRRSTYELSRPRNAKTMRALIVGTEDTISGALRQMNLNPEVQVIGLLAPGAHLRGLKIGGYSVMNDPRALPELLARENIDIVFLADAGMDCIGATVATATEFGVDIRLMPSAENILKGQVRVAAAPTPEMVFMERGVALFETAEQVVAAYSGKCVLVTGAGGSIGSEICRQTANLPIHTLLLFDQDENAIFEMNNQLRALNSTVRIVPLVGDIRDATRVHHIFKTFRPDVVLHAAAYKHVPVMEANCSEAILNNIAGTRILADAAIEHQSERFLMISSDKAVHPISVMGASKRVAEVLVHSRDQQQQSSGGRTRFACVRFGNVVGSRGSVVPIFLKQIAEGQPLTLTDEAMTRYFMTIPEAVQLVLQASTLNDGNIYMLDMGDPIKIKNLARKLIEMSGLRPQKDIEIRVIGLRPGEKLHEELWHKDSEVGATEFARVFQVMADTVPETFEDCLRALEECALMRRDEQVYDMLFDMPLQFPADRKPAPVRIF
jgi:FlaA1/EpsC-like NDP-sugar epimerase